MAAYREQSVSISRLPAKPELVSSDVLLISEYNIESDSLYYTDRAEAGQYGEMISAQLSVSQMKNAAYDISAKIAIVSTDFRSVRNNLDELSVRFLSNDQLTREIPTLSAEKDILSVCALSAGRCERIVDLGAGDARRFYLSAFSVNLCRPAGVNIARFIVPPEQPGLSRHFVVRVSSDADFVPKFYGNAVFFAEKPLTAVVRPGKAMYYDFKEVRRNGFYVRFGAPANAYDADSDEFTIVYHAGFGDEITVTFDSNDEPGPPPETEPITVWFDSNYDGSNLEPITVTFDSNDEPGPPPETESITVQFDSNDDGSNF